jgi:hypothetical protein
VLARDRLAARSLLLRTRFTFKHLSGVAYTDTAVFAAYAQMLACRRNPSHRVRKGPRRPSWMLVARTQDVHGRTRGGRGPGRACNLRAPRPPSYATAVNEVRVSFRQALAKALAQLLALHEGCGAVYGSVMLVGRCARLYVLAKGRIAVELSRRRSSSCRSIRNTHPDGRAAVSYSNLLAAAGTIAKRRRGACAPISASGGMAPVVEV